MSSSTITVFIRRSIVQTKPGSRARPHSGLVVGRSIDFEKLGYAHSDSAGTTPGEVPEGWRLLVSYSTPHGRLDTYTGTDLAAVCAVGPSIPTAIVDLPTWQGHGSDQRPEELPIGDGIEGRIGDRRLTVTMTRRGLRRRDRVMSWVVGDAVAYELRTVGPYGFGSSVLVREDESIVYRRPTVGSTRVDRGLSQLEVALMGVALASNCHGRVGRTLLDYI